METTVNAGRTVPDWLVPGARVLLYTVFAGGQTAQVVKTTVDRVATRSFTVTRDGEPRFPIAELPVANVVDVSDLVVPQRHCVPLDSAEARRMLADDRTRMLIAKADLALSRWQRERTRSARLDLIAALQAIRD